MTDSNARALRLTEKAKDAEALAPQIVAQTKPVPGPGEAVVEVRAAAINPSDVKAALGAMPHAVWPRTPGRDFAGRVVDGPKDWIGVDVWGTGGDLGVTRDGTHARYLVLPTTALAKKPASVSVAAAATVGVPFITAHEGLRRAHLGGSDQNVVVFGAHGKVGHGTVPDLGARVLEATGGRGADIAYNTVGSPYFQAVLDSLAIGGTQVLISTIDRNVPFDILAFYRRNLQMLGVDSLKLTVTACAAILNALAPRFDDGGLKAFDVDDATLVPIDEAGDAYRRVLAGSRDRVVFGF
jgi:NADPH:quinone reductase-like Zn-dependent oxidoreductase